MATEKYNIEQLIDNNTDKPIYPVTVSSAIMGPLSSKSYNINFGSNPNNWDNITETGFYMDEITTGSTGISRPPSDINTYGINCFIKVFNNRTFIIQETNYPTVSLSKPLIIDSINISKNYYRIGIPKYNSSSGVIESVDWNSWTEVGSDNSSSFDWVVF